MEVQLLDNSLKPANDYSIEGKGKVNKWKDVILMLLLA
jgi:hypothetical protein